ncbi:hypothetical protein DOY81_008132, partial [Sarcophaga bullata]
MNFNGNLTRKVKIITKFSSPTPPSLSSLSSLSLTSSLSSSYPTSFCTSTLAATTLATITHANVKTTMPTKRTVTAKVSTASVSASVGKHNDTIGRKFISSTVTSCTAPFTIHESPMPTTSPPHNKKITQLYCSTGMCKTTIPTRIRTFAATKKTPTPTPTATISKHETKQKLQSAPRKRTATAKATAKADAKGEVMLLPLTSSMSSEQIQILTTRGANVMDRDVETIQVTAKTAATASTATTALAETLTYNRDKPLSLSPPLQLRQQHQHQHEQQRLPLSTTTTTSRAAASTATPAIYFPILATAAEKSCRKKCRSIKMPQRHLILTIMAVVFSLEFTICTSAMLQQQLTTLSLTNNTHLPTATTNKSTKINDNFQNLPVTLTPPTTTLTVAPVISSSSTAITKTSRLFSSSILTSSSSPNIGRLVINCYNVNLIGTDTFTVKQTESLALSSLHWEEDDESELSLSTSILNTYDTSDLPPLSEAEQAAKDLLTKGFSIPTYLPPFPVFAVADLPAYLNTVSTTTTESPSNHLRPSDGYDLSSQEYLLYFDNLSDHQLTGQQLQQHRKLQNLRRNSSMAALPNITVQVGNHAYLPCHIHRLQNKPVSWVRLRDGHIISVDQTTFIADQRFQAIFQDDKEFTWSLQIKYVQPTDEGWYECQASSEPKMSALPLTELIGDQSRFVKAGSKVALHCIVRGTLDPPQYIIWYRDKIQISEDNNMGWYTQLDRNIFGNNKDNQNTIGSLIIPFVRKMDSGNYTCQPSNSASVSVDLHVLSGELHSDF